MAYSDWTLETVKKAFQLEEVNAAGIFAEIDPVEPSTHLATIPHLIFLALLATF
ncbi:MAG: hypothetical protein OXI61_14755 [Candidatus Poribacteria bacterium]|nr:hypothetical protein [Candidatus Poribacteria bacterium]